MLRILRHELLCDSAGNGDLRDNTMGQRGACSALVGGANFTVATASGLCRFSVAHDSPPGGPHDAAAGKIYVQPGHGCQAFTGQTLNLTKLSNTIAVRQLPAKPTVLRSDIAVNNLPFSETSLTVQFSDPNLGVRLGTYQAVDKYKVEWDTSPTFDSRSNGKPLSYNYEVCAACVDTLAGDVLTLKAGSPRVQNPAMQSLGPGTRFTVTTATQTCSFVVASNRGSADNEPANKVKVDPDHSCTVFTGQSYALALAGSSPEVHARATLCAACAKKYVGSSKTLTLGTALGVAVAEVLSSKWAGASFKTDGNVVATDTTITTVTAGCTDFGGVTGLQAANQKQVSLWGVPHRLGTSLAYAQTSLAPDTFDQYAQTAMRGVYTIARLTRGQDYYMRVTAHNSLGYGTPSDVYTIKPFRSADAPAKATIAARDSSADADERGTSLSVEWDVPAIDGGDPITKYMIEWSREPWHFYTPSVQKVTTKRTRD